MVAFDGKRCIDGVRSVDNHGIERRIFAVDIGPLRVVRQDALHHDCPNSLGLSVRSRLRFGADSRHEHR
jgi:hypothetical protein